MITILFRYTLPHRRKISAIGERVFWSALNKVTGFRSWIINCKFFHNKSVSVTCILHSLAFTSLFPGVAQLLAFLQYWKQGCDFSFCQRDSFWPSLPHCTKEYCHIWIMFYLTVPVSPSMCPYLYAKVNYMNIYFLKWNWNKVKSRADEISNSCSFYLLRTYILIFILTA